MTTHSSVRAFPHRILTLLPLLAASCLILLGVAACGDSSDSTDDSADGGGDGGDTITISHALGEAEITGTPERVVALGQGSAETAIALGVTPVGTERYDWGADESGHLPWIREAVEESGDELPELIAGGEKVSAEEIAALDPDLVLAPWSGLTQDQYDQISEIAPTIAYPEAAWTIEWEDQVNTIAEALRQEERGPELIEEIEDQFATVRDEHPEFADHDFAFIYNQGPGENMGVFMPDEQRAAVVRAMGFPVAPVVEELREFEVAGTDSAQISLEEATRFNDVDLIFTFYSDDSNREEMHAHPVYGSISAIERGAEVAPTDQSLVTGSSMINPLTVPWLLEHYLSLIEDALENTGGAGDATDTADTADTE